MTLASNSASYIQQITIEAALEPSLLFKVPCSKINTPTTRGKEQVLSMINWQYQMSEKVFLCSLDGATWDILDPLMRAGELPILAAIVEEGTCADLASTMPPSSPAAWTSFLTGVDPSTHGVFDFTHLNDDNEVVQQTAFGTGFPTLWSLLQERSYRVHSLNVPMTYPAMSVDGSMVSGLPAPAVSTAATEPKTLAKRIMERYERYPVAPDHFQERREPSLETYIEYITSSVENKFHLAETQLSEEDWDVTMLHIHETDIIQHCLWHYLDENHSSYDADAAERVKDVYRIIDSRLGSILGLLPDETTVIVLSDHGFRRNKTEIFINKWLQKKGYLELSTALSVQTRAYSFVRNHISTRLANAVKEILTDSGDEENSSSLPQVYAMAFENDATQAFGYGRRSAKLYLSTTQIIDELVRELEAIEVDGNPAVKTVHRIDRREGPDLIVEPNTPFSFESSLTSESVTKTVDPETDTHNGTHAPNGIFAAKGSNVAQDGTVKRASITDLLPTVLYALDEAIPNHLDGTLMQNVFDLATLEARPPRYTDVEIENRTTVEADDTNEVRERLEDLGYL